MLGGEASTTFDAATLQNFLAVFGAVSFHETVLNLALALVWLVCTLWHINILLLLLSEILVLVYSSFPHFSRSFPHNRLGVWWKSVENLPLLGWFYIRTQCGNRDKTVEKSVGVWYNWGSKEVRGVYARSLEECAERSGAGDFT